MVFVLFLSREVQQKYPQRQETVAARGKVALAVFECCVLYFSAIFVVHDEDAVFRSLDTSGQW